jgi:Peptidase family C25
LKKLYKIFILYFALSIPIAVVSQQSNSWIQYNQSYYKFPIYNSGIYKIDYTILSNAGIPINTINPKNIHLFLLGKEIPIFIDGEADNVFNSNDYIEFYASNTSTTIDEKLYRFKNGETILNPYVNLVSDTVHVFFTWNNNNGVRYGLVKDTVSSTANKLQTVTLESIVTRYQGYHKGRLNYNEFASADYNSKEGKGGVEIFAKDNTPTDIAYFSIPHTTNNGNIKYTVKLAGVNGKFGSNNHKVKLYYKDSLNQFIKIKDTTFSNFDVIETSFELPIKSTSNISEIKLVNVDSNTFGFNSIVRPVFYREEYEKNISNYIINNHDVQVADNVLGAKSYLDLSNYTQSINDFYIYDLTNQKKIFAFLSSTNKKLAIIPNAGNLKKILVANSSLVKNVTSLTPINGTSYFVNYALKQNSNPFIIISHKKLESSVNQYASYRNQKYNVTVAYVQDLYDQYGYGIYKHPIGIKNFINHTIDSCAALPKHLLFIGKGTSHYESFTFGGDFKNLVPTIGDNPSDLFYSVNLKDTVLKPSISTGRIAANDNNEVLSYLNKVLVHEADTLPNAWKKQVALFSGGRTFSENVIFEAYLNSYKNKLKGDYFGGNFKFFNKQSSAPIGNLLSDTIKTIINNGVRMLVFFGHGSTQGFDVNVDDPNSYSNINKYPFLFSNSCYSGNLYTAKTVSLSELWTFVPQKGSIGFLASSSVSIAYALNFYSTKLYEEIGKSSYAQPIGEIIKKTASYVLASGDDLYFTTAFDMNYQGDPSLKISNYTYPDYTITDNDVSIVESNNPDSLKINFNVFNFAKSISDTIDIKIKRVLGNGDTISYALRRPCPKYVDSSFIYVSKDLIKGPGINYFQIILDDKDSIKEYNENNNATSFNISYFIQSNDVIPVYPSSFAIIDKDSISLLASTLDPLAKTLNYYFEISRSGDFTPLLANTTIQKSGGIIDWKLPFVLQDSAVYYWRVRIDSNLSQNKIVWRTASFQYIKNRMGWAQADYNQFLNNQYQFIKTNKNTKDFVFQNEVKELTFTTGFYGNDIPNLKYAINGNRIEQGFCSLFGNGWIVVAIDSITGKPFESNRLINPILPPGNVPGSGYVEVRYGQYFNCHCLDQSFYHFAYIDTISNVNLKVGNCEDLLWRDHLKYFFNNIPQGTYLIAFSSGRNNRLSTFDNDLMNHFENMGANNIRNYVDTVPVIIYGKKGLGKGKGKEFVGTNSNQRITTSDSLVLKWPFGNITTDIIGPAKKWDKIVWKYNGYNNNSTGDTIALNIYGIKADKSKQLLFTVLEDSLTFNLANKGIDSIYPYLQIEAFLNDKILTTPSQVKKWQVFYQPLPDLAINANKGLQIKPSFQEGETAKAIIPVTNISGVPINNYISSQIWVDNKNGNLLQSEIKTKTPIIAPFATYYDTITTSTLNNIGNNNLWYDINNPLKSYYQTEATHFNNIVRLPFQVSSDKTNPLLDVSFDGTHILDGDIVATKPRIEIKTRDENQYLVLDDTSAYDVFLKYPNESSARKIFFNTLKFTKAQLPDNTSTIEFNPVLNQNGIYNLEVNAKDKSNNKSGKVNYKISFEIVKETSVTEILNYPNPFTTSTRFIYTLTGEEIPDVFKVLIYTISGKQIKEIDLSRDQIKIGKNISESIWDGKDEFGDAVGNGIYLYKVLAKIKGKEIKLRQSGADAFIDKGFGKMYLMR